MGIGSRQGTFDRIGRISLALVVGAAALLVNPRGLAAQDVEADAAPGLIGDAARDLVFTPVARCRVIDTRPRAGG